MADENAEPLAGVEGPTESSEDPLAEFAVDAARRQAVERGDDPEDVDEAFINRALAESLRMRKETGKSNQKRAANFATISTRHGEQGLASFHQAMEEHAAEMLTPQQLVATGLDGETGADAEDDAQQLALPSSTGASDVS